MRAFVLVVLMLGCGNVTTSDPADGAGGSVRGDSGASDILNVGGDASQPTDAGPPACEPIATQYEHDCNSGAPVYLDGRRCFSCCSTSTCVSANGTNNAFHGRCIASTTDVCVEDCAVCAAP